MTIASIVTGMNDPITGIKLGLVAVCADIIGIRKGGCPKRKRLPSEDGKIVRGVTSSAVRESDAGARRRNGKPEMAHGLLKSV